MPVKNIVIPLETEYLQQAAKLRGISRTRLVKTVMDKIVSDRLVTDVLQDREQPHSVVLPPKYRRFKPG